MGILIIISTYSELHLPSLQYQQHMSRLSTTLEQAHTGTNRLTQVLTGSHRYTQAHTGTHRLTQVHTGSHRYTQAHTGKNGYTQARTIKFYCNLLLTMI